MLVACSYKYTIIERPSITSCRATQHTTPAGRESPNPTPPPSGSTCTRGNYTSIPPDPSFQRLLRPAHPAPRGHARDPDGAKATQRKRQYIERLDTREKQHKPDSIPPAIAALLAFTAIPVPEKRTSCHWKSTRNISMDDLAEEWKRDYAVLTKYSAGRKAMNVLFLLPTTGSSTALIWKTQLLKNLPLHLPDRRLVIHYHLWKKRPDQSHLSAHLLRQTLG